MSTKHGPKSGKGKKIQGKAAAKGKRVAKAASAPEPVIEEAATEATDLATSFDGPEQAVDAAPGEDAATTEEPAATEPAPKRKRDMTIEDLQAEFRRVTGRDTQSRDRRYLMWRLSAGGLRRSPPGPIQKRPARDKADMQVLPLGMERTVVVKLDAAWKALGYKSRMAFLRDAMVAYLRDQEGAEANAAADAIEAEGF